MNNKVKSQIPGSVNRIGVPMRNIINTVGERFWIAVMSTAKEYVIELLTDVADMFEAEENARECLARERFCQLNKSYVRQNQIWIERNREIQKLLDNLEK